MNKLEKTKKLFHGLKLSSFIILLGVMCAIAAPFLDKFIQIEYSTVPLHWIEVSSPWAAVIVGLIIRIIDQWKGKLK